MTLATIAYRISTDVSFAAMLQKNTEETLQQAGIVLSTVENSALQKILSLPEKLSGRENYAYSRTLGCRDVNGRRNHRSMNV